MITAFRFLLISIILFASVSASAQSESKVFVFKTGAKYHRYGRLVFRIIKALTAAAPSPGGESQSRYEIPSASNFGSVAYRELG